MNDLDDFAFLEKIFAMLSYIHVFILILSMSG